MFPQGYASVHLRGVREDKFKELATITLGSKGWTDCSADWRAPFLPDLAGGWADFVPLDSVIGDFGSGVMPGRTWVIAPDALSLRLRWEVLKAEPDKTTKEQLFHPQLREGELALSATCNIRLSAAAVGADFNAFNRRRRKNPAFAREMRMALSQGYFRLETALLEGFAPGSHEHDDWRDNDPPAIPPMTVNQALQLLYLHQKEARLNWVEPHQVRRRPGESREAQNERLAAMYEARMQREREKFEVAEALNAASRRGGRLARRCGRPFDKLRMSGMPLACPTWRR
jgi:hypothetical protein